MSPDPLALVAPLLVLAAQVAVTVVGVIVCMTLLSARRRLRAASALDELRYRRMLDEEIGGDMPTGSVQPFPQG